MRNVTLQLQVMIYNPLSASANIKYGSVRCDMQLWFAVCKVVVMSHIKVLCHSADL